MKLSRIFKVLSAAVYRAAIALAILGRCCVCPNRVLHEVVKSPFLPGLEFAKQQHQQQQTNKNKQTLPTFANNRIVLSQGCRMGRAGPATFHLPDTELWPLLCWEQHCHGVTTFL